MKSLVEPTDYQAAERFLRHAPGVEGRIRYLRCDDQLEVTIVGLTANRTDANYKLAGVLPKDDSKKWELAYLSLAREAFAHWRHLTPYPSR